jgi:hypothetical protein
MCVCVIIPKPIWVYVVFRLLRFVKGRTLLYTILCIITVAAAAFFDAEQPKFVDHAIKALAITD